MALLRDGNQTLVHGAACNAGTLEAGLGARRMDTQDEVLC